MLFRSDVMTLPATGSEMNAGAVISNLATQEKFAFHHSFPQFSILDPEATFSLPPFQVACGIADTFVHVMEQYLTVTGVSPLMDRWAEGILQTLIEIAPKIRANQHDYDQMANFMLCATMGLNGFIAMGVPQDWATHMIGHELTALHGVTHGQTLVVVLPALMSVMREQKKGKILQYGERVFGIREGSEDERIDTKDFPDAISDEIFRKIVAVIRIAVPYTGMIISTRESQRSREQVLEIGISQISGGSRTSVGGYAETTHAEQDSAQFDVSDHRTLDEVVRWLLELGYVPSFCTACYREGRTGDRFMSLVKTGKIADCCTPNALMTLKEYLEDYASPETRALGEKMISKEVPMLLNERVRRITEKNLAAIAEGKRDFRF